MYRWLLQLSPETGCKYSLLFFSMLVQFAPIPFWNMVVNMNALLGKAECFCDCSIIFILFFPSMDSSTLSFLLFVCECMFVWRGETHRHCTGWLFSWFIIINHCNDSFILLVLTCLWENLCCRLHYQLLWQISTWLFAIRREDRKCLRTAKTFCCRENWWEELFSTESAGSSNYSFKVKV